VKLLIVHCTTNVTITGKGIFLQEAFFAGTSAHGKETIIAASIFHQVRTQR
jgi:hypothetical protein